MNIKVIINKLMKYIMYTFCVLCIARCIPYNKLSHKEIIKIGILNTCIFVVLDLLFPTVFIHENKTLNSH